MDIVSHWHLQRQGTCNGCVIRLFSWRSDIRWFIAWCGDRPQQTVLIRTIINTPYGSGGKKCSDETSLRKANGSSRSKRARSSITLSSTNFFIQQIKKKILTSATSLVLYLKWKVKTTISLVNKCIFVKVTPSWT